MSKLLVLSCLADDNYGRVSSYILKEKLSDVKAGMDKMAASIGGADYLYLLPEGEKIDVDGEVRYADYNPTLGNAYAVAQLLSGNLPRPMIQDGFVAYYDGKEVCVITPEEAYALATDKKVRFASITKGGNTEIKEVAVGTKLSEIVDASDAKAVLVGGQKGKFVKPAALESMEVTECGVEHIISVYGANDCIVDTCVKLTEENWKSSCGKCVLCREGSLQFKTITAEMTTGKAKATDVDLIKEVAELITIGAYCPYGQSMTNPIVSALNEFSEEFDEHIKKKSCKCGVCYKAEAIYLILPDLCTGCGDCIDECPEDAIEGKDKFIHMIDQDMCEQCGKCVGACDEDAIVKWEDGKLPKLPKKLTKVGKF